ncbi:MAG: hypothetical protein KAU21_14790 [Gammaproteobacteria bacterium]|nr:hypothetical protein [Gammaproteobacteria bacterium]
MLKNKKFTDYITWNNILAVLICVAGVFGFYILTQEYMDYLEAAAVIFAVSLVLFGFLGDFYNFWGGLLKVLSVISICVALVVLTRGLQDENILSIIRIGAAVITGLTIIIFIVVSFLNARRKDLIDNGYLLDTILEEIMYDHSDNYQSCRLKTKARYPLNGDMLTFKSQLIVEIPSEQLSVGDVVKVYVDKKTPKRYAFDLSDYID